MTSNASIPTLSEQKAHERSILKKSANYRVGKAIIEGSSNERHLEGSAEKPLDRS